MDPPQNDWKYPNGAVDIISAIIPTVVSAASEAEYAALFIIGQAAIGMRATLNDLGYPPQATDIVVDNTTAHGLANNNVKLKRSTSKAMDMRYHWTRDKVRLGIYTVTWAPGSVNLADFFTKAHPVRHFKICVLSLSQNK
jgi:hypothetical protein